MQSASKDKVLIIGAGPGGLVLAQGLKQRGIPYQIFERDESSTSRSQGYALTLHWMTIPQLEELVPDGAPLETLSVTYGTDKHDEAAYFDAFTKNVIGRSGGGEQPFLRVGRGKLRNWLMKGVDVTWGKRFVKCEQGSDGVKVWFEDGSCYEGAMLVGADGINSRVRNAVYQNHHLAPPQLNVLPIAVLAGELTLPKDAYTRQFANAHSMFMATAPTYRLFTGLKEVTPDLEHAEYYWLLRWVEEDILKPDFWIHTSSQAQQLKFCKEKASPIHDDFKCILEYQEVDRMIKPIVVQDMLPSVLPEGRITLVGDSSHPMSNFRGEGANNAMLDSLCLLRHLVKLYATNPTSEPRFDTVAASRTLREYEHEMVPRATKSVVASREAASSMTFSLLGNFSKPKDGDGEVELGVASVAPVSVKA